MEELENYFYSEYFNEFAIIPFVLPKNELYELFIKKENGDISAQNKIIEHNIRLVIYIVRTTFDNDSQNKKDLVSVGIIGLIKAVSTFDINKKTNFSSYATVCIKNEIKMYLRNNSKYQNTNVSLDEPLYIDFEGKELTRMDIIPSDIDIEGDYINNELVIIIKNLVTNLNDTDREIITLYFGFFNNKQHSQKEIAEKLGLSQSYTSRKIRQILKQLKQKLETISKNKPNIKTLIKNNG